MSHNDFLRASLTGHWPKPTHRVRRAARENGWSLLFSALGTIVLIKQTLAAFH